jgi:Transmembrane secretion effector
MIGGASILYAAALLVTALVTNTAAVLPVLVAAGMAWLVILVHVNASMQLLLPGSVRALGLAIYQITFETSGGGVGALSAEGATDGEEHARLTMEVGWQVDGGSYQWRGT